MDGVTSKYVRSSDNITPIHNFVINTGIGTSLTTLINFRVNNNQAFNDIQLTTTGTGLIGNFKTSGFQYLSNTHFSPTVDPIDLLDEYLRYHTIYADETLNLYEAINTGHVIQEDLLDILEEYLINYTVYCEEIIDFTEQFAATTLFEELISIIDEQLTIIKKTFTEILALKESTDPFLFFDVPDSTEIDVLIPFVIDDVTSIDIQLIEDEIDSTATNTNSFNLVTVTNASAIDNPFEPTIIMGGITYTSNTSTAPSPSYMITSDTYYVQWLNAGIGGSNACDILNFNFTLDYNGGSFSITSQNPIGILGQSINIFGLKGTITEVGLEVSQSIIGYRTNGIFGNPRLNKQLQFLVYGNSHFLKLLTSQSLTTPPADAWQTARAAAQSIASITGVNLEWRVQDAPLRDLFAQASSTGLEALSSLANQVGATLRWDGNTKYVVAYPNFTEGYWEVPNQHLITESGISYENILDLEYGVSGVGAITMTVYDTFDPTITNLPPTQEAEQAGGGVQDPDIQSILSITKPFTIDDPKSEKDLPLDTTNIYCQIVVTPTTFAGAAGNPEIDSVNPNGVVPGRFLTTDSNVWFHLGSISLTNSYIKLLGPGGVYKPRLSIDYTLFPNLSGINNGNFVMNFGIKRQDQGQAFAKAQDDLQNAQKDLLARTAINFIKTYDGSINSYFFGSIPLPGMKGYATACGTQVEGVIESVSLSSPGILAVRVAQYEKINFITAKVII